jgi:hypothetical protein
LRGLRGFLGFWEFRVVISPPEGGVATPIKQMSRYLRLGVAGEVRTLAVTSV